MVWITLIVLAQAAAMPMTTVAEGQNSGITEPKQAIVRTAAEWNALWKSHAGSQMPPAIDFKKEMVLAVFLGERPTGGFRVQIVDAQRDGNALVVRYAERRPGADSIVTQALTSPFYIVRVPRHEGAVRFERSDGPRK